MMGVHEMDVMTAIAERRSNGQVTSQAVAPELVEKLLQAACWAPNHKRTEPWRFAVFTGTGRDKLAAAMAAGTDDAEKLLKKAHRAPVIIAVWTAVGRGHKTPPVWEEYAAVDAAVQNMALAAHGLGLAGFWRTGSPCDNPAVHALLGMDTSRGDRVEAFFYVGHPDVSQPAPLRPTPQFTDKTTWFDTL